MGIVAAAIVAFISGIVIGHVCGYERGNRNGNEASDKFWRAELSGARAEVREERERKNKTLGQQYDRGFREACEKMKRWVAETLEEYDEQASEKED